MYRGYVIGLGRIGALLEGSANRAVPCTHAGSLHTSQRTVLAGGMDSDSAQVKNFQKMFPKPDVTSADLLKHLQKVQPHIVSVATSSQSHLEIVRTLLQYQRTSGQLQGILLEKPVGMNLDEGYAILELEQQIGVPIVVCHDRRFYPEFRQLRSMLRRRGHGALRQFRMQLCCGSFAEGRPLSLDRCELGGPVLHDGTHLMDFLLWMQGIPAGVSAIAQRHSRKTHTEDTCSGTFFFENGVSASFMIGGRRRYFSFELEVSWERARYIYSDGQIRYLRQKDDWLLCPAKLPRRSAQNPYLLRLHHLLDVIEGEALLESSVTDGLTALSMIEAVYQSARQAGQYVSLNHKQEYPRSLVVGKSYRNR